MCQGRRKVTPCKGTTKALYAATVVLVQELKAKSTELWLVRKKETWNDGTILAWL